MKLKLRAMKTIIIAVTVFTVLLLGMGTNSQAATIISTATGGNWSAAGSWIGGVVPTANDDVIITAGSFVTINSNGGCASLVVASSATLEFSRRTFTVSGPTTVDGTLSHTSAGGSVFFTGTVTINSGGVWNTGNEQVRFGGGMINNGTYNSGNAVQTFTGTGSIGGANPVAFANLTVTGTITNNGSLTVTSTLAGSGTFTNSSTGVLSIGGTSSITMLANAGTFTITGVGAISTPLANFSNTGTLNLNGTGTIAGITNSAGGTINLASSGAITNINNATATSTLNISAAPVPAITTLAAAAAGNTVNYNANGAQTAIVTTYSNLTLSTAGAKTFATQPAVNGVLSLEGTATLAITSGTLAYGSSATLRYNTTTARTASTAEWITPFVATGGVIIANTGAITLDAAKTFNTSVPLTITSGSTLNAGVNTLTVSTVNNTGTIRTQNTSSAPLSTGVTWGGTVEYDGAAQTISLGTYNNLTLSGSGAKSIVSGTSVAGNLSVAPSGTAKVSIGAGLKLNVGALALGGVAQGAGSYGSTSSAAINRNDAYFAPTTGYILYGAPIFTSAASTRFTFGTASTFTVTADASPVVTSITKSGSLPAGITFKDNGNGTAIISGTPSSSGTFNLVFTASNGSGPKSQSFTLTIVLTTGLSAADTEISVVPNRHLFGVVNLAPGVCGAPVTFTVRNAGTTPRTLGTLAFAGSDADQFVFGIDNCSANTLAAKTSCTVEARFCPSSTGSKSTNLLIPSDDLETPILAAALYNHESIEEEASRRLPPILESLAIPVGMAAGQQYTITWSQLGYDEDYVSRIVFFKCTGLTVGACGSSYGSNFADSGNLVADSTSTGAWSYTNGTSTVFSKKFNYSYTFTAPAAGDIVIRFYHKSISDDAAGLATLSLLIPGKLNPSGTTYYDNQGRRLHYTILP